MEPTTNRISPYVSFVQFYQSLDRIAHAAPPVKVNAKLLKLDPNSGIYSHLIGSYRFFDLMDESGLARDELLALAKSSESERKRRLRDLLLKCYPFLQSPTGSFDFSRTTFEDLQKRFAEHDHKSPSVTRKSANFFAAAADFAGIDLPRIPLKGYKPLDSLDGKRNSSMREAMNNKSSSTGRSAEQVRESEKEATEAKRTLFRIFYDAKELPDSEREVLAKTFIDLGQVLMEK